jgi:hypothetical protein
MAKLSSALRKQLASLLAIIYMMLAAVIPAGPLPAPLPPNAHTLLTNANRYVTPGALNFLIDEVEFTNVNTSLSFSNNLQTNWVFYYHKGESVDRQIGMVNSNYMAVLTWHGKTFIIGLETNILQLTQPPQRDFTNSVWDGSDLNQDMRFRWHVTGHEKD